MTFGAFETSTESSRPIELYEIVLGTQTFFYTSAEDDIVISATTYIATPISRNKLAQGPEEANRVIEIEVPGTNEFARNYISSVPSERAVVTIKRVQRSDFPGPQVITLFEGFVKSVAFGSNGRKAKIAVQPSITAASRIMPRYTYQGSCNHVVYDERCQADDTSPLFRLTGTVTAVSGALVTVAGASGFPDDWFTGGSAEALGGLDARLVLDHAGDVVTLLLPFPYAILGQPIILLAGCAHDINTCKIKFANVINYGGFAFVPTKNPFATGIGPVLC